MKAKLKINILDFDDIRNPLLNAGQARSTFEISRRLVKMGLKVTVISSKYPGFKDRIEEGIVYKHIGLGSNNIKLNNVVFILAMPFSVKKLQTDLIIECMTAPISTLLTPLFTKSPVVLLPSMFNAGEFSKKYHLPFHLVEKFGMKLYRYIMPYSDVDFSKARQLNPEIIGKKIPQGVSREYFRISHKKPKHILFLGRLDIAQKGIELLLMAYAKIKNEIGYPLVIAGHGPDEKKVRSLISKLKLNSHVKLAGPAYNGIKSRLISESLMVAFPSRHDEMSLWSLEALASGLPLVIFDLPEFKWVKNQVVFKAKSFDTDDYADKMLLAAKKAESKSLGSKCRNFAKMFSWDTVADEYKSFIFNVLNRENKIIQ